MSMMEILRTESLGKIRDGQLALLIDSKLREVYDDCVNRPLLKTARKVVVEIIVTPTGQDDPLEDVDIEFTVQEKVPKQAFNRRFKSVAQSNGFGFAPDTDSLNFDPKQTSFDDE